MAIYRIALGLWVALMCVTVAAVGGNLQETPSIESYQAFKPDRQPPVVERDCRQLELPTVEESHSKVVPALGPGHSGRFASVQDPCIRLDYWFVAGYPQATLQLTVFTEDGEALQADARIASTGSATFDTTATLFDVFEQARGAVHIRARDGGCSRLLVVVVVDDEQIAPRASPGALAQFTRYVSAVGANCVS